MKGQKKSINFGTLKYFQKKSINAKNVLVLEKSMCFSSLLDSQFWEIFYIYKIVVCLQQDKDWREIMIHIQKNRCSISFSFDYFLLVTLSPKVLFSQRNKSILSFIGELGSRIIKRIHPKYAITSEKNFELYIEKYTIFFNDLRALQILLNNNIELLVYSRDFWISNLSYFEYFNYYPLYFQIASFRYLPELFVCFQ